ncbi:MAG TPA: hypothetical protein DCG12_12410 [Planctomycetaceae bacterium]|nr:hypothetical protein [Planctomycetaceae bacterium]
MNLLSPISSALRCQTGVPDLLLQQQRLSTSLSALKDALLLIESERRAKIQDSLQEDRIQASCC